MTSRCNHVLIKIKMADLSTPRRRVGKGIRLVAQSKEIVTNDHKISLRRIGSLTVLNNYYTNIIILCNPLEWVCPLHDHLIVKLAELFCLAWPKQKHQDNTLFHYHYFQWRKNWQSPVIMICTVIPSNTESLMYNYYDITKEA